MRILTLLAVAALTSIKAALIDHDKVQPFTQPEPITVSEKAAVKFKPSLVVKTGCHPYPVVNAAGGTSGGLKGKGDVDGDCKGSHLGSQVYSRSMWYEDRWAIMYAWYFPKNMLAGGLIKRGVRHDWANLVVWLDNPAIAKPTILATSASISQMLRLKYDSTKYHINKPPKIADIINGTTPKLRYDEDEPGGWHTIFQFHEEGKYQDLIQWDQLTDAAREALNKLYYDEYINVPFNDAHFEDNLKSAATYFKYNGRWFDGPTMYSIWENSSAILE